MITFLGVDLSLPAILGFAANPVLVFTLNLAAWLGIAVASFWLSRLVMHHVMRRSRTRLDDILVGIVRKPIIGLLAIHGFLQSWETAFGSSDISDTLQRLYNGALIIVVAYAAWRILHEVVIAYLKPKVQETDSQADDIIIPILGRIGPVILIVAVANAVVAAFGGNLAGLLTGLGLLGLVIGYVFQEPLQGLFSGTYMVLDNPFRQDDLLLLEDGRICQVRKVGIRVTQLYEIKRHVLIYVPNAKLAGTNIVNMTKPSLELRLVLNLTMERWTEPGRAIALIEEACHAHPNILGRWSDKQPAIARHLAKLRAQHQQCLADGETSPECEAEAARIAIQIRSLEGEALRLEAEHKLRRNGEEFSQDLLALARMTAELEDGGLSESERGQIRERAEVLLDRFDDLVQQITAWLYWLRCTQYELNRAGCRECKKCSVRASVDRVRRLTLAELAGCPSLEGPVRPIVQRQDLATMHSSDTETDKAVPREHFLDRANYTDYRRLYYIWHRNIAHVYRRLLELTELRRLEEDEEYRLDERIATLERHFADAFLLRIGRWQQPSANLVEATGKTLKFQLELFVDDLVREQFQREERVTTELLSEIDRLRATYTLPAAV